MAGTSTHGIDMLYILFCGGTSSPVEMKLVVRVRDHYIFFRFRNVTKKLKGGPHFFNFQSWCMDHLTLFPLSLGLGMSL